MKKFLLALPLMLAACQTIPDVDETEKAVRAAVAAESAVAARCFVGPLSFNEWRAVTVTRLAFDTRYASVLSEAQSAWLTEARVRANQACSIQAPYLVAPLN